MRRPIPIIRGGSLAALKTYQSFNALSGVDNLDPSLTINGTTVTPTFRYKGGDADATDLAPWGYGETLPRIAVATPPTYNDGSPGLGANDDSCKFNSSDYYEGSLGVGTDTDDFAFEIFFKYKNTGATGRILDNRGSVDGKGIRLYHQSGVGTCLMLFHDGASSSNASFGTLTDDIWYFLQIISDKSESTGTRCYLNGSLVTTDNLSAIGSLGDNSLSIGARLTVGDEPSACTVAYCALWHQASWGQGGAGFNTEADAIAAERFARLCGYRPQKFSAGADVIVDGDMETAGVADWSAVDSTLAKDTTAPLNEGTQHLRITSTTDTFWAGQTVLKAGVTYRISGSARSVSGSAIVVVHEPGYDILWTGTTSTSWQDFDFIVKARGIVVWFGSSSNDPGVVDFDNIKVIPQNDIPTTATRAFPAYLDKIESGESKLYYVGGEWLRMCHRQDSGAEDVYGYLPETQNENLFPESEDFSTWDLVEPGTVVVDNAEVCPDGRTVMASIAGDSGDEQHGISDDITLTAATYSFSGFAKPGNKDWIYINNSTVANCDCYFDVANGTVGTDGAGCTGYIEGPFYNGSYRWCIVFTGTVAAHTLEISPAQADTDKDFIGDGSTVNTYVWGAQVEQSDYMTSPIVTSGAAQTRLKDNIQPVAGANIGGEDNAQGTIVFDLLLPNHDNATTKYAVSINDGGASADSISCHVAADDTIAADTRATAGNDGDATVTGDCADGNKHEIRVTWEADNVVVYRDGVAGTADSSAGMPDDLDKIGIGQDHAAANQLNGLISNFRIYKKPVTSG